MMLSMEVHLLQNMYTTHGTMANVEKQNSNLSLCAVICFFMVFPYSCRDVALIVCWGVFPLSSVCQVSFTSLTFTKGNPRKLQCL